MLAGRKNPVGLSGEVLIDGKQQPKNFKCMTGYVVQASYLLKKDAIHALCRVLLANKTQGRIAGGDGGQFPSFKVKTY